MHNVKCKLSCIKVQTIVGKRGFLEESCKREIRRISVKSPADLKFKMAFTSFTAIFCLLSFASQSASVPMRNAHDIIMLANDAATSATNAHGEAAEDKIIKINEADGIDLLEGDMKLSAEEYKAAYGQAKGKRSVLLDRRFSWRTRIIPYQIDHSTSDAKSKIQSAMNVIMSKVPCLKFREKQFTDSSYIRFHSGVGCWSYIGKRTSVPNTDLSLGPGCLGESTIIHEIMHALGFFHEQSRPDRDSFVTILYENIDPSKVSNFNRMTAQQAVTQGTLYDYSSIMHYSTTSFSTNGEDTMIAKFDRSKPLGDIKMSDLDILELNKIYQCHVSSSAIWSEWTPWSACLQYGSSCKRIKQRFCFSENNAYCSGADEYGVQDQTESCTSCKEPMNGHWNNWGSWSTCSKQCDEGLKTRYRVCDNPVPSNGGDPCSGSRSETVLCRIKKCNQHWYDTSFEDGWGMWQQSLTDSNLNWIRGTGRTPTSNTGPDGDHTTTQGYYAYVEAGYLDDKKTVTLKSSQLPANFGDKCLTFYYNMNGKNMGSLIVKIVYTSGSSMWIWDKKGHQGNHWKAAATNLPNSNEPFILEIQGRIGISPDSDIAIDDIFIDDGKCPSGIGSCKNQDSNCESWAKSGECHKNPYYMLPNCCASCSGTMGECTTDVGGSSVCAGLVKQDGCTQNSEWMWANCCKSCKECLDTNLNCPLWASNGECDINPTWMKVNCKTSCNICKA